MNAPVQPALAVRVVIENSEGAVLALRRGDGNFAGFWNLPGGKVEFGQSLEAALRREVAEETGLAVGEPAFLFFLETLPTPSLPTHYLTFYFHCRADAEPVLNDESSAWRWIRPPLPPELTFAFDNDAALRRFWRDVRRLPIEQK
jgi:8-oxo-dGTP diphosphatase